MKAWYSVWPWAPYLTNSFWMLSWAFEEQHLRVAQGGRVAVVGERRRHVERELPVNWLFRTEPNTARPTVLPIDAEELQAGGHLAQAVDRVLVLHDAGEGAHRHAQAQAHHRRVEPQRLRPDPMVMRVSR